jgi:hypothetical protein
MTSWQRRRFTQPGNTNCPEELGEGPWRQIANTWNLMPECLNLIISLGFEYLELILQTFL